MTTSESPPMTDTAELKPVAWRARRYGSSEWEVFGYDPRALKQFSFFEPLYSADALTSPASEVEQIIAASTRMAKRLGVAFEVNPAKVEQFIRGTSPASGPVQPRSEAELATDIEKLKSEANRQYHALEAAEARATAAEAKRDEALGVLAGVDALGKKMLAKSEADNVRLRAAITTLHVHMMDISSFTPTVSSSVPLMDQIVRHARATIVEMVKVARKALGGKDE